MRIALVVVVVVAVLAGCGGGGVISVDPGGGTGGGSNEWTYTTGDRSVLGAWTSSFTTGITTNGVSVSLLKNGEIQITAVGAVTGSTSGTADTDGKFSTSTGTIRASGTVTHLGASLQVWNPAMSIAKVPFAAPFISEGSYSAYKGTWTGTYKMSDGINHPLTLIVDSCGYVTGTIAEGAASGSFYGRQTTGEKEISFSVPYQNASQTGWAFGGTIDDAVDPDQASGTVVGVHLPSNETGTWTVTKQ